MNFLLYPLNVQLPHPLSAVLVLYEHWIHPTLFQERHLHVTSYLVLAVPVKDLSKAGSLLWSLPGDWVAGAIESKLWPSVQSFEAKQTCHLGSCLSKVMWPFVPHTWFTVLEWSCLEYFRVSEYEISPLTLMALYIMLISAILFWYSFLDHFFLHVDGQYIFWCSLCVFFA